MVPNYLYSRSIIKEYNQKYYHNEPRFSEVCSRGNLPTKIKHGEYIINLDKYSYFGMHWIDLYALNAIPLKSILLKTIPLKHLMYIQ